MKLGKSRMFWIVLPLDVQRDTRGSEPPSSGGSPWASCVTNPEQSLRTAGGRHSVIAIIPFRCLKIG